MELSERPVSVDSSVYYQARYWNDFPQGQQRLNAAVSGDPAVPWHRHFQERVGRRFRKALILNCGNGWVERELIEIGLIEEGVGVDYLEDLLAAARAEAAALGHPLRYYQMDTNTAAFPEDGYDLVVNYAAAHHIACLDRVFRELCRLLAPDGWLVSMDYVGPHRNQWPYDQWAATCELNEELPPELRKHLQYPHLPSVIAADPTEAIHSELIMPMLRRYFDLDEYSPVGGALAYLLLTFNDAMFDAPSETRDPWVDRVLQNDWEYLEAHPESTLFAYAAARPNKRALSDDAQLRIWADEETRREDLAARNRGLYYPLTPLQELAIENVAQHEEIERLADERNAQREEISRLRNELEEHRHRLAARLADRVGSQAFARSLRKSRVGRAIARRAEAPPR